jgi:multicomponent Na+:H+ antiporter subunit G
MTAVLDVAAAGCMLLGALLNLIAGVGLLRFPDAPSRLHALAKPQVLGVLLVLLGLGLRLQSWMVVPTLLLIAVFQLATSPVAAHMVARAAYRSQDMQANLLVDELAGAVAGSEPSGRARDEHRRRKPPRAEDPEERS